MRTAIVTLKLRGHEIPARGFACPECETRIVPAAESARARKYAAELGRSLVPRRKGSGARKAAKRKP